MDSIFVYAVALMPVVAVDEVELDVELEPEVKLGKNCCRSDCNDA